MTTKKGRKIRKGNLRCPLPMKVKKIAENIYFKQELTESALSERTAPSLDRNLDEEFCTQV